MEQVWQWIRRHQTHGTLFTTDEPLDGVVCDALDGLGNDPTQVKSLTSQRWLYTNISY